MTKNFNERVEVVFLGQHLALAKRTDRLFAYILLVQWFLGIVFAAFVSPRAWAGEYSEVHIHLYAAIFLGGLLSSLPCYFVFRNPGATINRLIIAISQMLFSTLFIHLMGGRIEAHFHIFGSLAFLAIYRDWRPLMLGTLVTAVDHFLRGALWPQSVYGVLYATPWRAVEHALWVIYEDLVLLYSIRMSIREMHHVADFQVRLEDSLISVEEQVEERTRELKESQRIVLEQQQSILAASKMSVLGEMAGAIAHEINNPLAIIQLTASQLQELLKEELTNLDPVRKMSGRIEATATRIAKIIQGLRSFSRDGSKDPFEQVNMFQMIEETLSFSKEKLSSNGTDLEVANISRELFFDGRATEISQVVLNLLNNAHDAIHNEKEKWIRLAVEEEEKFVRIIITDSGKGIPASVREKIFQPFFTTKENGKGTGLGLSISAGIVRNHHGELSIDAACSNTRFVIRLPKKQS